MERPKLFHNCKAEVGVERLYSFVLLIVLVGMVIGVGVLTMEKFSAATFYQRNNYNNSLTPTTNNTITNLDHGNITNVDKVYNGTENTIDLPSDCYSINDTPGKFLLEILDNETCVWDFDNGREIWIFYDYKEYDTATSAATYGVSKELSTIATDWIGLIVTVFILSIILFFVIRSFQPGMGDR